MKSLAVIILVLAQQTMASGLPVVTILDCGKDNPTIKNISGRLYVSREGTLEALTSTKKMNVLKSANFSLVLNNSAGATLAVKQDGNSFSCSSPQNK